MDLNTRKLIKATFVATIRSITNGLVVNASPIHFDILLKFPTLIQPNTNGPLIWSGREGLENESNPSRNPIATSDCYYQQKTCGSKLSNIKKKWNYLEIPHALDYSSLEWNELE